MLKCLLEHALLTCSFLGDDEELRYVESNAIRSYIEGLLKSAPDVNGGKWTKKTLAEHIMVGGLGVTCVGTPAKVADEMERWVNEADVDGFNIVRHMLVRPTKTAR